MRAVLSGSQSVFDPHTGIQTIRYVYTVVPELEPTLPALPWVVVRPKAKADNCSICLNRCSKGKELPCGHVFHLKCLVQCFRMAEDFPACPNCRMNFVVPSVLIHDKEYSVTR